MTMQPSTLVAINAADLNDPRDRVRIDDYVRTHPDATPFHLTGWNVAVARACGQTAHCLIAEQADGEIAGVLPLTEIRSPLFGKALVSTGFAVDGGILTRRDAVAEALAASAWALAEKLGCPSLELRGGPAPGEGWIVDETTYLGFACDLAADDEAQLLAIPRKQRAEVRKSLDRELHVAIGNWPNDLAMHYAVFSESVRNLGTPVFPSSLFREVAKELGDHADVVTVSHRGTPARQRVQPLPKRHRLSVLGRRHARGAGAEGKRPALLRTDAACPRRQGVHALRFRTVEGRYRGGRVQEELGVSRASRCATPSASRRAKALAR